jgi:hypothetical protein
MFDVKAMENEARALLNAYRFEEAEALIRPALATGSGPIPLWVLLAQALRGQTRVAEARPIQEMLVDALPGDLSMRFDLAETLLVLGEFDRGWREYQYRYNLPHTIRLERKVQRSRWDGRPLEGRTLLIHDEQGYGDTLQFLRMIPWAKQRSGGKVILEINHELHSIAKRMGGFDALTLRGELPPPFDVYCEMMSLPMTMRLQLSDLPGTIPYLSAEPDRLAYWKDKLKDYPRPLVALVWAGRPTHTNDANRSMKLEMLAPLAIPGVTFVSIQKGPTEGAALNPPPGMNLISLSPSIRDFEDTAAILSLADLLISVDSSPVHLAGALNRPAWVMLPRLPDWRWLLNRDDTPWYPSVRLFRQQKPQDWAEVVGRIASELTEFKKRYKKTGKS